MIFLFFSCVPFVNTSIGSKPRTSPNCSNCGMDGRKSSFSMREISERLMPVASARDCCVMESFFRLDVIRSARRAVESVFMVGSFLKVILNNKMREQLIALYRVYVNFTIECYLYKKLLGEINNSCTNACSLIL